MLVYGRSASRGADPSGIGDLFQQPVLGGHVEFWDPVIEPHRLRTLVGPDSTDAPGKFDSSLRFNVARATGLLEGRNARLAPFAPYYREVDPARLMAICMPVWARVSDANARRCAALLAQQTEGPAIRIRDLGNIVSLRSREGSELALPPVAKYALGTPEPVALGRSTGFNRRRLGAAAPRRFEPLETLIRDLDAAPAAR